MQNFRKKQKRIKRITNSVVVITAAFMFVYIGIQPYLERGIADACEILSYILVAASLILLFVYISKYAKADKYLENIEYAVTDAGYYLTSRKENDLNDYCTAVTDDIKGFGYKLSYEVNSNELIFDVRGLKPKEFMYIVKVDDVDRNDVISYLDSAVYDASAVNLKRKGNGVMLFICNHADESAVSLSKDITVMGRKGQLIFAVAIAELTTGRIYFLGNKPSKCQQMIVNFVMNCDLPLKDKYISKEKLPFQSELQDKMKKFDIKALKEKL